MPSPETDRARQLRKNMTTSESRLWFGLRRRQLDGWKFRRQAPIGPYVVDLVCLAARLVVELDGASHDDLKAEYDERRQRWLESQGFKVLRLSADYPEMDPIEGAWEAIDLALSEIPAGGPLRRFAPPPRQAGRTKAESSSGASRHLPGKRGGQIQPY